MAGRTTRKHNAVRLLVMAEAWKARTRTAFDLQHHCLLLLPLCCYRTCLH